MASPLQRLTILGSTGSIGLSTLDVVARHPDRYQVFALSAHGQLDKLVAQCAQFRPRHAVLADPARLPELRERLAVAGLGDIEASAGVQALEYVASHAEVDAVMAAIVGAAGMRPTLAAARAGKRVLLANKETLVMAGRLFMDAAREGGATLLPIDSEHNAIYQCLPQPFNDQPAQGVQRILLTASGGPFRQFSAEQLREVTPAQAVKHPNWSMGRKISVDSASLMNKGLEVIEARWLFDLQPERIAVVVHPQSVIHSMVEYVDGSVLAQLGNPDMRTPIAYGLAWPERIDAGVASLDLFQIARLDFEQPDTERFPCLALAFEALRLAGAAPAVLNAANEEAVAAFLDARIGFTDIAGLNEAALRSVSAAFDADSLDSLIAADASAREFARGWLSQHGH
ncbi:1-deoxy-D-xylulose-5-phosphate reductoisomerase [Chitinimonas taiwanensis]|uniref:1-deoxy-D-xylulose 5-phosphate reductoisomerase n=1 Tax=Chitinimonas taiwanensis DSM 18899 TaxID=1121279 RepID=A0A1K2HRJ5_9NEIS|nr:1-deoxy-D-xylulose-5-phosphate reductoisomerase [Chitinimonas taiwanensis]SFZ79358.1 1-deoxy-D-xylulose 5-phosphate reductoisomerase [Chitinimonas taiwanensis DSM 18899]